MNFILFQLLKALPILQQQVDALIEFDVSGQNLGDKVQICNVTNACGIGYSIDTSTQYSCLGGQMITVLLYYSAMVDHWIGTQTSGLLMAVSRLYRTYHPLFLCIIHNAPLSQLDPLCIVYLTRIATICTTRSQELFLTLKPSHWLCHVRMDMSL